MALYYFIPSLIKYKILIFTMFRRLYHSPSSGISQNGTFLCHILGFCSDVDKVSILLWCDVPLGGLALEDESTMLPQNVRTQIPNDAASHPRRNDAAIVIWSNRPKAYFKFSEVSCYVDYYIVTCISKGLAASIFRAVQVLNLHQHRCRNLTSRTQSVVMYA
jgi:hypothetical protein